MRVVSNTSPLILLSKIERLELLIQLYGEILVPPAVFAEIEEKPGPEVDAIRRVKEAGQIRVQSVADGDLRDVPAELGPGERESIALALGTGAELILLDDQEGRVLARRRGLAVSGTVGVLVEAKIRGHLASVRTELDRLVDVGFWLAESLYDRVLREVGE